MTLNKKHTGLFFGSFDPVHIGHLIIAEYLLAHTPIGEIWFVVSPQNPFKTELKQTPTEHRINMLRLATQDDPAFSICDVELSMPPPHYTIDTLHKIFHNYPERDFALIIGSDNLQSFEGWKNYQQIPEMLPIYVYPRHGYATDNFSDYRNITRVHAPLIEISSTYIRQQISENKPAKYMVPAPVLGYIKTHGLYRV